MGLFYRCPPKIYCHTLSIYIHVLFDPKLRHIYSRQTDLAWRRLRGIGWRDIPPPCGGVAVRCPGIRTPPRPQRQRGCNLRGHVIHKCVLYSLYSLFYYIITTFMQASYIQLCWGFQSVPAPPSRHPSPALRISPLRSFKSRVDIEDVIESRRPSEAMAHEDRMNSVISRGLCHVDSGGLRLCLEPSEQAKRRLKAPRSPRREPKGRRASCGARSRRSGHRRGARNPDSRSPAGSSSLLSSKLL